MNQNSDQQFESTLDATCNELTSATPTPDARLEDLFDATSIVAAGVAPVVSIDAAQDRTRRRGRIAAGAAAAAVALLAGSAIYIGGSEDPTTDVATSAPVDSDGDLTPVALVDDTDSDDPDTTDPDATSDPSETIDSHREWLQCMQASMKRMIDERLDSLDGHAGSSFGLGSLFGESFFGESFFGDPSVIGPGESARGVFGTGSVVGHPDGPVIMTLDDCGPPPVPALPGLGEHFDCGGPDGEAECGWPPFDLDELEQCVGETHPLECIGSHLEIELPPFPECATPDDGDPTLPDLRSGDHDGRPSTVGRSGFALFCGDFEMPSLFDCESVPCDFTDLPSATVCDSDSGECHDVRDLFDQFPVCLEDDSCLLPDLADIVDCAPDDDSRECWKITIGSPSGRGSTGQP